MFSAVILIAVLMLGPRLGDRAGASAVRSGRWPKP